MNHQDLLSLHQAHTQKYRLLKVIGQGTYGKVFKATCEATGETVAVKFIDFRDHNQALLLAVCREIKINLFLARLKNNIFTAGLLDLYLPSDCSVNDPQSLHGLYMVSQYCPLTLTSAMTLSDRTLTHEQVVTLVYNLLCAIKYLHSANILHRDLKPENILVTEDLEVLLCDFGLSRSLSAPANQERKQRPRELSETCFTRFYRPPEVILGSRDYDQSADVWSLGCLLSEVFQKTVKKPGQIKVLFNGGSCFPHSPAPGFENKKELNITSEDQMIKIISTIGATEKDAKKLPLSYQQAYVEQILAHPSSKPNGRLQRVHEDVDPVLQAILRKILRFDPRERATISELLSHPLFAGIRQEANERPAEKKLYLRVDQLSVNQDGQPLEYSSRKLLSYLAKTLAGEI